MSNLFMSVVDIKASPQHRETLGSTQINNAVKRFTWICIVIGWCVCKKVKVVAKSFFELGS